MEVVPSGVDVVDVMLRQLPFILTRSSAGEVKKAVGNKVVLDLEESEVSRVACSCMNANGCVNLILVLFLVWY